MITLNTAQELKAAGLKWSPALHDFFAVPDRGMDHRVFVISDMLTNIENLFGSPVVAFQGASEWALDYLVTSEAVWVPTESQLRQIIEENLLKEQNASLSLSWNMRNYQCEIFIKDRLQTFEDPDAATAYGKALLYILNQPTAG